MRLRSAHMGNDEVSCDTHLVPYVCLWTGFQLLLYHLHISCWSSVSFLIMSDDALWCLVFSKLICYHQNIWILNVAFWTQSYSEVYTVRCSPWNQKNSWQLVLDLILAADMVLQLFLKNPSVEYSWTFHKALILTAVIPKRERLRPVETPLGPPVWSETCYCGAQTAPTAVGSHMLRDISTGKELKEDCGYKAFPQDSE